MQRIGKLPPEILRGEIFPRHGQTRTDVVMRSAIGEDAAAVSFGDEVAVLSTDPVTGAGQHAGWIAVHVGCNDIAVAGGQPVGILVTLLLTPESGLADARAIMSDVHRAALDLDVEVIGGHSEITSAVSRSVAVVTAIGRCRREYVVLPKQARPGNALLLTKAAGLEGTAVLASDFAALLATRLAPEEIADAQSQVQHISVVPEALAAARRGATAMHDATEGGVIGAIAELAQSTGCGVDVNLEAIPIRAETRAICSFFNIDPLQLVSSGALLIATPFPEETIVAGKSIGVEVTRIGCLIDGPSILRYHGKEVSLVPPRRDALWDARERAESWGISNDFPR